MGAKWRVRWDDVTIGESVHSCKVMENAGSVEEIEDDVVMAEHDSDEELPAEDLAEAEPEMEEGGGTVINRPVSCQRHQIDHSR